MPRQNPAKLKNQAQKFLQKGKLDKALEIYQQLEKVAKNDLRVPQKVAEIQAKMGNKKQAIEKYKQTAEKYLENGFLVQAIAINKVILELDPHEEQAKAKLDELMAERTGGRTSFTPKADFAKEHPAEPEPEPVTPEPEPSAPEPIVPEPQAAPVDEDEQAIALPDEEDQLQDAFDEAPEHDIDYQEEPDDQAIPLDDEDEALEEDDEEIALLEDEPDVLEQETVAPIEADGDLPAQGPEHTPLFSDLNSGEFDRIFELLKSGIFETDELVFSEGDQGDSIYIIARGQVDIIQKDSTGRERLLATLGPSDFFGEFGYFAGAVRTATVKAKTRVHLLELTKQDTDNVTLEFPRIKQVMLEFYKDRVVDTLLATSDLFKGLKPEERHQFIERCEFKELEDGEIVVKEGDKGDSMFVIKRGEVDVTGTNPIDSKIINLARLKAGELFGEVSLIKGKPRTATITADGPVELLEFNRAAYDEITVSHPEITKVLEDMIEKRVEDTIQIVTGSAKPEDLV